ncbi:MAG: hypothetical protein K0S65_3733 [Labilithrix sp.]|nr:hypothetical protein [Labilithrix sp.]
MIRTRGPRVGVSVRSMTVARTLAVLGLSCLLVACPKRNDGAGPDAAPDGSSLVATADAGADAAAGDDVDSVYPVDPKAPLDPLAQKLCAGLSEMPEKKRAACCTTTPGIVVTTECARTLSAALRSKAVELAESAVDGCVAAFERSLEGCDWVGPFPPGPPKECQGIVKGLLGEGAKCRSSLECMGSLRCAGVGPTTPGKCSTARAIGELCGGTTDTLATYVRQNDLDKQHPECATGHCIKHRCAMPIPAGGVCHVTLDCAEGLQCLPASGPVKKGAHPERKCAPHSIPTREGEACPGGLCAGDLQCIMSKCTRRKGGGEACTNDFECRGGCVRTGTNAKGTCGPRCDIR